MRQANKNEETSTTRYQTFAHGAYLVLCCAYLLLATLGCRIAPVQEDSSASSKNVVRPEIYLTRVSTQHSSQRGILTKWNVEIRVPSRHRVADVLAQYGTRAVLEVFAAPGVRVHDASTYAQKEDSKVSLQLGNLAWGSTVKGHFTLSVDGSEIPPLKSRLLFRKGGRRFAVHVAERRGWQSSALKKSTFFQAWRNRSLRDVLGQRLDRWLSERRNEHGNGFVY